MIKKQTFLTVIRSKTKVFEDPSLSNIISFLTLCNFWIYFFRILFSVWHLITTLMAEEEDAQKKSHIRVEIHELIHTSWRGNPFEIHPFKCAHTCKVTSLKRKLVAQDSDLSLIEFGLNVALHLLIFETKKVGWI